MRNKIASAALFADRRVCFADENFPTDCNSRLSYDNVLENSLPIPIFVLYRI